MRSTMTEDMLSSLALICIEKEVARHLEKNIEDLVTQFPDSSNRRFALSASVCVYVYVYVYTFITYYAIILCVHSQILKLSNKNS